MWIVYSEMDVEDGMFVINRVHGVFDDKDRLTEFMARYPGLECSDVDLNPVPRKDRFWVARVYRDGTYAKPPRIPDNEIDASFRYDTSIGIDLRTRRLVANVGVWAFNETDADKAIQILLADLVKKGWSYQLGDTVYVEGKL